MELAHVLVFYSIDHIKNNNMGASYVLVFCVLTIFLLINVWLKLMTLLEPLETLGSLIEDWMLPFSANIPGWLELDAVIVPCYTVILAEDLLHLFIQWMLIVQLDHMRHYRGYKVNEKQHCRRAQDIANIDVILSYRIIMYVEGSRYEKNIWF